MRAFLSRLKAKRAAIYRLFANKLIKTRFANWLNDKPETWYWVTLGVVAVVVIKVAIMLPVNILALYRTLKKKGTSNV